MAALVVVPVEAASRAASTTNRLGAVVAVEIESAVSPYPERLRHAAWLRDRFHEVAPGSFLAGVLLHTTRHSHQVAGRVHSVPLSALWRLSC